jgi:hypothetical protein
LRQGAKRTVLPVVRVDAIAALLEPRAELAAALPDLDENEGLSARDRRLGSTQNRRVPSFGVYLEDSWKRMTRHGPQHVVEAPHLDFGGGYRIVLLAVRDQMVAEVQTAREP